MNLLKEKNYKSYSYLSRYTNSPYYYHTRDDKYISATDFYLDDKTPYRIHIVQRNETFDTLALEYYNNPTLYWIICSFNHIQNPYDKLKEGTRLKIPSISTITFDTEGRS